MIYGVPTLIPGSAESEINDSFEWTATRKLRAYFDPTDSEAYVRFNLGPGYRLFNVHPQDPDLFIRNIRVRHVADQRTHPELSLLHTVSEWEADISYGPYTPLLMAGDGNPVNIPATFSVQAQAVTRVCDKDKDDKFIGNTAGDPFNPAVEIDEASYTLIIRKNFPAEGFDLADLLGSTGNYVNKNQWGPFEPLTMRLGPVNLPEPKFAQIVNQLYYPMEFQFVYRKTKANASWTDEILNLGFRQLVDGVDESGNATQQLAQIYVNGQPAEDPCLLDNDGKELSVPVNPDDVVFIQVKKYPEADFSALGLDEIWTGNFPGGA